MGEKKKTNTKVWKGVDGITVLSAVILGIVICRSSELPLNALLDHVPILDGLQVALILDFTAYLLPVLVCLPGVMRMYEERSGGYDLYHMFRVGRSRYTVLKLLQSMRCGARVILGAVLVYFGYALFYAVRWRKPFGYFTGMIMDEDNANIYYIWQQNGFGFCVFLVNVLFLIALAMFWNIFGTVVSMFVMNRRVAVVAPFLFKRFLEYLIPEKLFFLNPANLRMSAWVDELPFGGIWYGVLYLLLAFLLGWIIIFVKLSVEAVR